MTSPPTIDAARFLDRLRALAGVGRDAQGRLTRLAASDADRAGRDAVAGWMREAGLEVRVDRIGNLLGLWRPEGAQGDPVMIGSHIDTVVDAGAYDGCVGVLAGLAVVEALREAGGRPAHPLAVAAFTNEEGVRYAPDMLGSLVYAGGLAAEAALATVGVDGTVLGEELSRIGYAGPHAPGFLRPRAYVELHVEQGPVLEREGTAIGAVAAVQGISWQEVTIEGAANHAGTTPMALRRDAGVAAARVVTWLRARARAGNGRSVATVGRLRLEPEAINVIPARAVFTVDLRDPDAGRLAALEADLAERLDQVARAEDVAVTVRRLARFDPVAFDPGLVRAIEAAATRRGLSVRRMISGAGHDAQMMARLCPAAMIFVPSAGGISHSPHEHTSEAELVAGATVLLDVVRRLSGPPEEPAE
ncbi:amidase, hydantoinase/carbamoylase family [Methylobacterium sp. 4-46]|uniref:Zn-dependent hydrolase n=1 Tax=unclassified Methylobacterium TaxID=2615210 RepID=UPI000152D5EB|nr:MULTISPECIES: Zn-dependent hydrolase [Methylobacterium]ACA15858.1 amidase, hydantoinase/carbamoylase family [Methylobacterium sp. 4-46]WFT81586.1 Zn-dependent hydrolase [Methylobacterium nodulans]